MTDSEENKFVVRNATVGDLKFPTRFVVENSWRPFGPGDYLCAFNYDPDGFFVGEANGEVVSHLMAIKYPNHSTQIGSFQVQKEHRKKGYGEKMWDSVWKTLDHDLTIGLDSLPYMIPMFESYGFRSVWKNSIALLNFEKIVANLRNIDASGAGLTLKPIRSVDIEKLVRYDASVFGSVRSTLVQNWIKIPGSMGWAVLDENGDILGYTVVRPIILHVGMEIGMNMAPLYAENDLVASALLKVAAETCLANEAVSASNFLLIHAHGTDHGQNASQLYAKVEVEYIPFATRMYTKGVPKCGQLDKIYGIMHPTFD